MSAAPWWFKRVLALREPADLHALGLGALYRLCESLQFVRDNVDERLLVEDFADVSGAARAWEGFLLREVHAQHALRLSRARESLSISRGVLPAEAFRAGWQALGYQQHEGDAGTPADDYLDGLFFNGVPTPTAPLPPLGNANLATRARRAADFLSVIEPREGDVVIDIGSGNGKFALTVAVSTTARVVGVEYCEGYVSAARESAASLALRNVRFDHADARDVDLSEGSVFYLYHPFRDEVASAIAAALGALARQKDIRVYSAGPLEGFGEHFEREVERGTLKLRERRGEFFDAMVLASR